MFKGFGAGRDSASLVPGGKCKSSGQTPSIHPIRINGGVTTGMAVEVDLRMLRDLSQLLRVIFQFYKRNENINFDQRRHSHLKIPPNAASWESTRGLGGVGEGVHS